MIMCISGRVIAGLVSKLTSSSWETRRTYWANLSYIEITHLFSPGESLSAYSVVNSICEAIKTIKLT